MRIQEFNPPVIKSPIGNFGAKSLFCYNPAVSEMREQI